jgi:hypothetical protein
MEYQPASTSSISDNGGARIGRDRLHRCTRLVKCGICRTRQNAVGRHRRASTVDSNGGDDACAANGAKNQQGTRDGEFHGRCSLKRLDIKKPYGLTTSSWRPRFYKRAMNTWLMFPCGMTALFPGLIYVSM